MHSDGLSSALSPVVYRDIGLSIKINTQIHKKLFFLSSRSILPLVSSYLCAPTSACQ